MKNCYTSYRMATVLPQVKLENFEGPFDLLLELAQKRKLDLSEISLRTITDDFLGYIREHDIPAQVQGDFLVVASTLLLVKARQLVPSLTQEEEEEVAELTDRVRIYRLYRQQADAMQKVWGMHTLLPAHFWGEGEKTAPQAALPDMTADMLSRHMADITNRLPKPIRPRAHLTTRGRSLDECLALFSRRLHRVKKLVFQQAIRGTTKQEAAVSFLAVLEMARKQEVELQQEHSFSELIVKRLALQEASYE
jgi:segregation and condensation protein A